VTNHYTLIGRKIVGELAFIWSWKSDVPVCSKCAFSPKSCSKISAENTRRTATIWVNRTCRKLAATVACNIQTVFGHCMLECQCLLQSRIQLFRIEQTQTCSRKRITNIQQPFQNWAISGLHATEVAETPQQLAIKSFAINNSRRHTSIIVLILKKSYWKNSVFKWSTTIDDKL